MPTNLCRLLIACILFSGLLLAGCQAARVSKPVVADLPGNDEDAQLDFWHTLAERTLTSNDDALHGMLLYLDGQDPCTNYPERVAALKQRGLLSAKFELPADEAVRRGTVAVMFVRILSVKGGWAMHVFGPTQRYAVRELQYMRIFPYSSPQQTFSGSEFVGVIGALEDYQKSTKPSDQPTTAPSETNRS